jgi:glycosyltransferase involved in cell wall biosynthesis
MPTSSRCATRRQVATFVSTSDPVVVDVLSVGPDSGGVGTVAVGVIAGLSELGTPVRVRVDALASTAWREQVGSLPHVTMDPVRVALGASSTWQTALRRSMPTRLRRSALVGMVRRLRAKSVPTLDAAAVWVPFHRAPLAAERAVVTVHDLRVFGNADSSAMDRKIIAQNVKKAAALVCSWPHPTGHLIELFPDAAEKIFTIPLPLLEPGSPVERALPLNDAIRILVPAFVTPHKNQAVLVRALAEMPDSKLIFTGAEDGDYADRLRALAAELGVADRIEWRGRISRAELAVEYDRAHVLAMPTRWEAASGPVFEAIARELPFIASDIAPIRSQLAAIDVDAELFDPDDPHAVAASLRRVIDTYEPRRAALRAPGELLRRRTWKDAAADYARVLDWTAGRGPKPSDLQRGKTS